MAWSIIGAGNVARVLASIFPWLVRIDVTVQPHEVNGQPGAILRDRDSKVLFTLTLDVLDGQIQTVRSVSNPDKLGHLGPVGSGTTARRRAVSVPESRERAWRSYGALAAWRSGDLSARRLVIVSSRGDDAMRIPQLLARAEERIASLPLPDGELVFVHGDLWQGNTICPAIPAAA